MQLRIMAYLSFYELRVILTAASMKYISEVLKPKVISFFQDIRGAVLQRAPKYCQDCQTLFIKQNICSFFRGLLILRICHLLNMYVISLVSVLLVIPILQLQQMNCVHVYKQYGMLFPE